jgi:hypothetical protein
MPRPLRRLFAGLFDDAALFPPRNASMAEAVSGHAAHRASDHAAIVGPLVCPTSRVDELLATVPADAPIQLALVVDSEGDEAHAALRTTAADPRVSLVAVEAARARLGDAAKQVGSNVRRLPGVTGYLEVDRADVDGSLELVGDHGWSAAKLRTGGATAEAFPGETEVAQFLLAVNERGLSFKLTAGLHHAVRATESGTGFEQHGLVNVLAATADVLAREDDDRVVETLAVRQAEHLVERVRSWSELDCLAIRGSLRSIGCCDIDEPVRELAALGLLPENR